ncbi:MAG: hypothetical protein RBT57_07955 [Paludibacter sp.]|jgi:hypothetical protein|nr:hypothetical protein [Paludibacter sp.]
MRTKITFALLLAFCFQLDSTAAQNEHILAKLLHYTGWSDIPGLMADSYEMQRNKVISNLDTKCNTPLSALQSLSDNELADAALMHKFLAGGGFRTVEQLSDMSLDDFRNTLITLNAENTEFTVSQLQAFDTARNLFIAHEWWLKRAGSDTMDKKEALNEVSGNTLIRFDTKDTRGVNMDGLSIIKADEAFTYLAVYHSLVSGSQFKLYLAGSNDLNRWTYLTELGDRSHQGDIKKWGNGYVVANEQDPVQGSNTIRVRYYASYAQLLTNSHSNTIVLPRNFSNSAEGTPDIRSFVGTSPDSSHIVIGFHYYNRNIQDQIAFGILKNFASWRAWKDEISNYNIQQLGFRGNFGDRCSFVHNGNYILQEAQLISNDWSSWRLLLGDGAYYSVLSPVTPKGSVSFANPSITGIGLGNFVVSSFMPTEGNQPGERGQLLYKVNFKNAPTSVPETPTNEETNQSVYTVTDHNELILYNAQHHQVRIYSLQGVLLKSIPDAGNTLRITLPLPAIIQLIRQSKILTFKYLPSIK